MLVPFLVFALLPISVFSDCRFDTLMGATYDLSPLVRTGEMPSYSVTDGDLPCTVAKERNFTYNFNVCNQISGDSLGCGNSLQSASAIQIDKTINFNGGYKCYVAGNYDALNPHFNYFVDSNDPAADASDPSKGIVLTYFGDSCHGDIKRMFHIEFICSESIGVPIHAYEVGHCEYAVKFPTMYGCPIECPISGRSVCGGHGFCSYDTDIKSARCFCYDGYYGNDCSSTSINSNNRSSPAVTGIIITLFVISVIFIVVMFVMIRQMKGYKQDASNYMALRGGETEMSTGV